MNKKTVIGITVGVVVVVAAVVAVVVYFSLTPGSHITSSGLLATQPPSNYYAISRGKDFSIVCRGVGDDRLYSDLRWIDPRGYRLEAYGSVKSKKIAAAAMNLSFTNPEVSDSGVYKCKATYDGREFLQIQVHMNFIENKPNFFEGFQSVIVDEESSTKLVCSAYGEQPMIYTWYNENGEEISSSNIDGILISTSASASELIIISAKMVHEGQYSCTASNRNGEATKVYHITVLSTSENATKNISSSFDVEVDKITENSVRFHFSLTGLVHSIVARYAELPTPDSNPSFRNNILWRKGDVYEVNDLVPAGRYMFEFQTFPSENNSWSEALQVVLLPDVPEIIVNAVSKGFISLQWLRKVDDIMRGTIDGYQLSYKTAGEQNGTWISDGLPMTIDIPSCSGASHTIGQLSADSYYEVNLRAHTESGYGRSFKIKFHIPRQISV